jgi:hypothetical protein
VVVQVARLQDGSRKIVGIAEVLGVEDNKVQLQDIFTFERVGVNDAEKVQGRFQSTGVKPASWSACASRTSSCRLLSSTSRWRSISDGRGCTRPEPAADSQDSKSTQHERSRFGYCQRLGDKSVELEAVIREVSDHLP